jgi:hypothetical protein
VIPQSGYGHAGAHVTVEAFPKQGDLASQILGSAGKQIAGLQLPPGYRISYEGLEILVIKL